MGSGLDQNPWGQVLISAPAAEDMQSMGHR